VPKHQHRPGHAAARLNDRPTWLISRAYARSSALLNAGFEAHGGGLRGYHYRLLAALDEWGPASQADLGRSTGIDRSDVTASLAELESRNLIQRTVDPENKRRNIVTLTPEGVERLRDLDIVVGTIQDELMAPLTASQRRQFITLISRLLDDSAQAE
jgi:MarR family transcriptional regulator, lower aerobic nicotinate degradation pathway regulator